MGRTGPWSTRVQRPPGTIVVWSDLGLPVGPPGRVPAAPGPAGARPGGRRPLRPPGLRPGGGQRPGRRPGGSSRRRSRWRAGSSRARAGRCGRTTRPAGRSPPCPPWRRCRRPRSRAWRRREELDRALRVAFFGQSRCISLRSVILEVAGECESVDVDRLQAALDDGRARRGGDGAARGGATARGRRGQPPPLPARRHRRPQPGRRAAVGGRARAGLPGGRRRRPRRSTPTSLQRAAALAA